VVDDHEIFRMGLRTVLRYAQDIEVTGESGSGPGLLDRIEAAAPDLVLLDLSPGQPGAFDTLEAIRSRFPHLKTIAMTGEDNRISPLEALSHKPDGYIKKESSSDLVRAAIKLVALGGSAWHPDLLYCPTDTGLSDAPGPIGKGQLDGAADQLSPRERRLLSLLAGGKTNKQMGLELKLAQVTVKKALQGLFIKLDVKNRTQAAMKASQLGLI
jgi:DNA-binding NarL/FixJ family response regulator